MTVKQLILELLNNDLNATVVTVNPAGLSTYANINEVTAQVVKTQMVTLDGKQLPTGTKVVYIGD